MDRLLLHEILVGQLGSRNVYFQPPADKTIQYPCIVYKRDSSRTLFADNSPYRFTRQYQVTVIDRNPDSLIPDKVAFLPLCQHRSTFTANNLNHYVFNLYY